MKKQTTIRDVARQAGVSVATASRVLNGRDVVNDATRRRVLEVMEDLRYTPSSAARNLSLGRTLTITVVTSFLTRPQAAERLRGIDASLADSQFDLVIYNVESIEKRNQYFRTLPLRQRTDGLIVVSLPPPEEDVARLEHSDVPIVFVDARQNTTTLPRVLGDDVAGGALAAEHLLDLGHRQIGFVGDAFENPFGFTSSKDRFAGFQQTLSRAGIKPISDHIAMGGHGRYEAHELAVVMLSRPSRPTAIFAASDTQALGVLAAAQDLGLHVPDDLSVIGYDDIEASDFVGLTTIRQQLFESGRAGAQLLMAEITERAPTPQMVVLEPHLVRRRTTASLEGGPREP
ncbi:MAG: LacI family DNA-binding transcriptional regulator [Chloroflexi bacterium]|nr:LacI family DNA-binding transcriptional regulator [Chloroflexota bacterium]